MNVKFSTKFVAASAAAVMALSLAGCSGITPEILRKLVEGLR